jgi:hypothetical protein
MKAPAIAIVFVGIGVTLLGPIDQAVAADPTIGECLSANDKSISLRNEHKLLAARAQLLTCAAASCPGDIRKECTRRIDVVNASIPTVVFEAKDASGNDLTAVIVKIDGELLTEKLEGVALSTDPGAHTFTFEAPGQPVVSKKLVIREGQRDRREVIQIGAAPAAAPASSIVTISAPPSASAKPAEPPSDGSGSRVAAYVAGGIGVAGLAVGTIFGLQAMSKHADADKACPAACADQSGVKLWDDARAAGNVSTIGFIVGGIGIAGGAVLWFTSKPSSASGVQVGAGPTSIRLRGTF